MSCSAGNTLRLCYKISVFYVDTNRKAFKQTARNLMSFNSYNMELRMCVYIYIYK